MIPQQLNDAALTMREWPQGASVRDVTGLEAIRSRIQDDSVVRWVDIVAGDRDTLEPFVEFIGVDDQLVEYTFEPMERPKLSFIHNETMFVVYATYEGDEDYVRVSGVVKGNLVVTVRSDCRLDIRSLMRAVDDDEQAPIDDADAVDTNRVLYTILDGMVDTHFETIQQLDGQIDDLESELFDSDEIPPTFAKDAYLVRKQIAHLRRVVLPMREVAVGLERHRVASRKDPWFQDLEDHVLRAVEWTESIRDVLTGLMDTQLQLQDQRTNIAMKKLAAWAAIIAIPTLITGFYGQNVPYPGFSQDWGFWTSTVLIVATVVGFYWLFKKIDWL